MSGEAEDQRQKAEGLPEGWESTILEKKAKVVVGFVGNVNDHYTDSSGVPFYRTQNVRSGRFTHENIEYVTQEFHSKNRKSAISNGDILIARVGANLGMVARVSGLNGPANSANVIIIRPDESLDTEFCTYFLNSGFGQKQIFGGAAGGAQGVFNTKLAQKIEIPLPPLPEQRKIAAILSTWDDSLSTLARLLDAKRQQKRGLAEQLLTGKTRLKGFEGAWESHLLGLLMPQKPKETAGETEYPILSVTVEGIKPQSDHFNKRVASEKTSDYLVVRRGEIAMSGLNFWMGAIDMQTIEDAGVISPAYKVFRTNPKKFNSDFARHFIRSEKMRQILLDSSIQGASIVRRNLDMQSLKESEVMVPTVPEQQAIASVLSTLDAEIASLEAVRGKVQEQKRGLMDELLTGRVRVAVNDA